MSDEEAAEPTTSGDIFEDFSGFVTASDSDYESVLRTGIVVLDTNILLDLYRQHSSKTEQLFEAMEVLGDRIWFPHQVLDEFHRGRQSAAAEPADEGQRAIDELGAIRTQALSKFRAWAKRAGIAEERESPLRLALETGFDEAVQGVGRFLTEHDPEIVQDTSSDPILRRLNKIVTGRRGSPMSDQELRESIAEGNRRIQNKIPPGYKDAGKKRDGSPTSAVGDYLVWEQFLSEAAKRGVDGLLVTRDVKEDWFRRVSGETVGPRNELSEEFRHRTGNRLFLAQAGSWLFHMRSLIAGSGVLPEDVVPDSASILVDSVGSSSNSAGWTADAARILMGELESYHPAQFAAVRRAFQNGGSISRDEIYAVAGFDLSRSLRGFTRPIDRITRLLIDSEVLPYAVNSALTPFYDSALTGNNRAVRFDLAADFSSALDGMP